MKMRIRKSWFLLGLLCILLTVPVFQSMAAGSGTVKNRVLNVRSSASTSSSIVCKLSQGTKVTIQSDTKGTDGLKWYQISCTYNGANKKGYVRADLLNVAGDTSNTTSSSSSSKLVDADKLYVKASSVRVRDSASLNGEVVAGLTKGSEVHPKKSKTGDDGKEWIKVSCTFKGAKVQGYIRADLLTKDQPAGTTTDNSNTNNTNSTSYKEGDTLYVTATAVRVRKQPSTSETVVANLLQGDQGTYIKEKKGSDGKNWVKISFKINGTEYQGYVSAEYLTKDSSAAGTNTSTSSDDADYRYVTASAVRVRKTASDSDSVVANLLQGDKVKFKKEKKGDDGKQWTKISFTMNGQTVHGYVHSDVLSKSQNSSNTASTSQAQNNTTAQSSGKTMKVRPGVANVRAAATTTAGITAKLPSGTQVSVVSENTGADGKKWSKISFTYNGTSTTGYIRSDLLN